ncbi:hypothetical protein MMC28_008542 [Mycoblastus sanguinarius]|nr:hypothetical protein [Mycoblastus sanguinarius]
MQRRGSVSSNGSAPDGLGGLQRRDSGGSMTERSFRDAPQNRPASSHGPYARYDEPPPVPALPKGYTNQPSVPQKAARRAASVEPPERVSSPPPRQPGGRGVSLDRGPGQYQANQGGTKAKVTKLDTVGELERVGYRGSVNFSRPMSPQNSPPTSPLASGRVRSPPPTKPTTVAELENGEADRIAESLQQTANQPVKKKKKVIAKGSAEGSHLATGTTGGPPQGTSLEATPQRQPPSVLSTPSPINTMSQPTGINEAPRPKQKKKKATSAAGPQSSDASEGFGASYPSDTDSVTSELSSTTDRPRNYNTRAAGLLAKQPSIVREDREAEEQAEKKLPPRKSNGQIPQNGTVSAGTPANTSKIVSKDRQHNRSVSQLDAPQATKRISLDVPGAARPQSLSPARAAHFSSHPEYQISDGTKHQPPARSVSPAKSALKYSPSRGHSPVGDVPGSSNRRPGLATSEGSDTASQFSDDGSRSASKKKKSARVSFDENSVTVGRAASPPSVPESPVLMSPQNKAKSRSWFDLVREKKQEAIVSDSDQDNVMKPTPALPSFGSIRSRNDEPVFDSVKEQEPSEEWAQETLRSIDTSTDQVVGSLIAQDAAARASINEQPKLQRGPNDPLPPEVTSLEGSGYHSDEEAYIFDERQDRNSSASKPKESQNIPESSPNDESVPSALPADRIPSEESNTSVPSIALQPATPALESGREGQSSWLEMPGGFPESAEATSNIQPFTDPVIEHRSPETTPATIGIAEPEPECAAAQHDSGAPHVGAVAEGLRMQIESQSGEESEDTGGSIYSDAAEDPDDLDGDGFGSINAIVESPASPILPLEGRSPPVSPSKKAPISKNTRPSPLGRNQSELSEPAPDEGWDRAQAYWSGLSQTRRQQLEYAAAPGALEEPVIPNKTMRGPESIKKKKKKVVKKPTVLPESNNPPLPPWPDRQYRNDVGNPAQSKAPLIKSSMRNPHTDDNQETHLRSSMRNGPSAPPQKSSLRNGGQRNLMQPVPEPRGALVKKNRPVSAVAMIDYNKPQIASPPTHARAASAGGLSTSLTPVIAQPKKKTPTAKPKLLRNDSDSSSSFKKTRPSTPNPSRYTMKRTMRPSSTDSRPQSPPTMNQLSARTSSPTGSPARRPFSSVGTGTMRTSMRESIDSGKPARTSLRGSMDSGNPGRTKSPSRFGFGKASKPKQTESKLGSGFSSRFGDSSDEDDGLPALSSRFADSSGDDEPVELTPVRGIPRRIDEGDSTDLEDSSVENVAAPAEAKVNGAKAPATTKPEGTALATGSLRTASGDGPTTAMGTGLQAKKAAEREKKKRSFFSGLGSKKRADTESPARVLSTVSPKASDQRVLGPSSPKADPVSPRVERAIPNSQTSAAQSSPKSPKLQRRHTPQRLTSASQNSTMSWPLPQSPGSSTANSRPRTSDGPPVGATAGRPDLGTRRSTQSEVVNGVVGKLGKKKRFPMLRKAFGLHD